MKQRKKNKASVHHPGETNAAAERRGKSSPGIASSSPGSNFSSPFTGSPVQRYKIAEPSSVSEGTRLESQHIRKDDAYSLTSERQFLEYSQENGHFSGVAVETTAPENERAVVPEGMPPMKVSVNDKLAVNNSGGQARDFFATDEMFTASNQKLENVNASIRLGKEGGSMKLTEEGEALDRIIPLQKNRDDIWQPLVTLNANYCNQVLSGIIGGSHRAAVITMQVAEEIKEEAEVPMKLKDTDPLWARELLSTPSEQRVGPEQLGEHYKDFFRKGNEEKQLAVNAYAELDNESKRTHSSELGTNEYARPEVGEGYMTSSVFSNEYIDSSMEGVKVSNYYAVLQELEGYDNKLDISGQDMTSEAKTLLPSWSYHFATVMARDEDDNVTLENYNRSVERENLVRDIFHELYKEFETFRLFVAGKLESIIYGKGHYEDMIKLAHDEIPATEEQANVSLREKLEKANRTVRETLAADSNKMNEMFYFQMYGPGEQSLHEEFRPTGYNPLTVRVRTSFESSKSEFLSQLNEAALRVNNLVNNANWQTLRAKKWFGGGYCNFFAGEFKFLRNQVLQATNLNELTTKKQYVATELSRLLRLTNEGLLHVINSGMSELIPFAFPCSVMDSDSALEVLEFINAVNDDDTFFGREKKLSSIYTKYPLSTFDRPKKEVRDDLKLLAALITRVKQVRL